MAKPHSLWCLIVIIASIFTGASCSSFNNLYSSSELLAINVGEREDLEVDTLNRKLRSIMVKNGEDKNVLFLIAEIWPQQNYQSSVVAIDRTRSNEGEIFEVVLIYDAIADDDSISGFRYDIKVVKRQNRTHKIISAKRSWRCWNDRGHTDFSTEPCV